LNFCAGASATPEKVKRMTYEERANLAKNPMAKLCFELMASKSTNLCVAVDTVNVDDVLKLAAQVGPYICVLKTHVDMFEAWDASHAAALQVLCLHTTCCPFCMLVCKTCEEHGFLPHASHPCYSLV
jgi:hypothetical protein